MSAQHSCDVLIVGSGAAGLSLALQLAPHASVTVISKSSLTEASTYYAQGGMSAVLDANDSVQSHLEDTLTAGAGLCDPDVVQHVVERGARCVEWLVDQGVDFTRQASEDALSPYHLTREGGHSHRRVIHVADATGRAVEGTLADRVLAHPNIAVFESQMAIDVIPGWKHKLARDNCLGAYVLDLQQRRVSVYRAKTVVLACGGAGKVYLYTSNPDVATGDGIAMAWRAGCRVSNMEFVQFHPTCLYHPQAKSFLITEAIRGEGARLLLPDGEPFMHRFDARAELAPRDIVARAIDHEMKRLGVECVYLDISMKPRSFITQHFPNIYARCKSLGIDMSREPIPVVPAAHYTCGGVAVNLHGQTDVTNLYAIGEVAHTGLHGANRMASNSLLECLVFAEAASESILSTLGDIPVPPALPEWDESRVTDSDEEVVVSHNWDELRRFMWDYVGIVRTTKRLERAKRRVDLLLGEIEEYYGNFRITGDLIELRNLALVADLIIRSALARAESRGLHHTLDFPNTRQDLARDTVITPRHNLLAERTRFLDVRHG